MQCEGILKTTNTYCVSYIGFTDVLTVPQPLNKIINLGLVYSVVLLPTLPRVVGMLPRE